jgi:hypothetical protein
VWKRGVADNPWPLYAVIGSLLLQLAVVYTDVGQNLFDTVGLSAETWPWIIGLSLLAFAATALVAAAAMPRATTPAVTPNRRR